MASAVSLICGEMHEFKMELRNSGNVAVRSLLLLTDSSYELFSIKPELTSVPPKIVKDSSNSQEYQVNIYSFSALSVLQMARNSRLSFTTNAL